MIKQILKKERSKSNRRNQKKIRVALKSLASFKSVRTIPLRNLVFHFEIAECNYSVIKMQITYYDSSDPNFKSEKIHLEFNDVSSNDIYNSLYLELIREELYIISTNIRKEEFSYHKKIFIQATY